MIWVFVAVKLLILLLSHCNCKVTVQRRDMDLFRTDGKLDCFSYNGVKNSVFCECRKTGGETFLPLYSNIGCDSINKECTREFEKTLIHPGMKPRVDSTCHNCNGIEGVYIMNITETFQGGSTVLQGSWVDITNDANFNSIYDKQTRELDVLGLNDKWHGHLVKIRFNGNQCAIFKFHGLIIYPLQRNIVDVLFGKAVSSTITPSITPKTTVTQSATPTETPVATTTPAIMPSKTITTPASTVSPKDKTTGVVTPVTLVIPTSSTKSAVLAEQKTCEEKGLPSWVAAVFGILFVLIIILCLILVWLCRKRSKEDTGDEISLKEKNFGPPHSLSSSHLLPPDGYSNTPDIPSGHSTPVDDRKKKQSSACINVVNPAYKMSIPNQQDDGIYLAPVDQPSKPQNTGDVYSPLSDYPSNVYAESTVNGSKENLVYVELEKENPSDNNITSNEYGLIYAELEKDEECLPENGRIIDAVYSPLEEYTENVYVA